MNIEKRPIGYRQVPQSMAADVRALIRAEGIAFATELFQLSRATVLTVAAETQVHAKTIVAIQSGLKRIEAIGANRQGAE